MPKRKTSITDIARIAGVSIATVSNVLNGKGRYSEATRILVTEVARREGYVASTAARTLRSARTNTVGILTPDISNEFYATIVRAFIAGLFREGITTFVCDNAARDDLERTQVQMMLERQVDGIAFVGGGHVVPGELFPTPVPVVAIDRPREDGLTHASSVNNSMHGMVHDMTSHLVDKGCRHIGLVSISRSLFRRPDDGRFSGFEDALADRGMIVDRNLVLERPHHQSSTVEAEAAVRECLGRGYALDGLVCIGDRVALGAVSAVRAAGLTPGTEVLVAGMDDSSYSRLFHPTLTSVGRNVPQLASTGVAELLRLMSGDEEPGRDIVVPHALVERESTRGV